MNCSAPADSQGALAKENIKRPLPGSGLLAWLRSVSAVVEMEARKLLHDPMELITRAIQPAFWLLIFGQAFGRLRALPTSGVPYQAFLTPGILAQSTMFISIFYGIAIIWERDLGLLQKFLAMPLPRSIFVLGKALAAGFRSLTQVMMILALAAFMQIPLRWHPFALLGVACTVILGSVLFASFSMILAVVLKTRERFMGFGQLFTMPLFFASNALYPVEIMPAWLQALARVNPLTYIVELLRGFLVSGDLARGPAAFGILIMLTVITIAIAARVYPRAAH